MIIIATKLKIRLLKKKANKRKNGNIDNSKNIKEDNKFFLKKDIFILNIDYFE